MFGLVNYEILSYSILSDIDDCTPNPCLYGGTCVDGVDSYTCTCIAGYNGINCGTSKYIFFCTFSCFVLFKLIHVI